VDDRVACDQCQHLDDHLFRSCRPVGLDCPSLLLTGERSAESHHGIGRSTEEPVDESLTGLSRAGAVAWDPGRSAGTSPGADDNGSDSGPVPGRPADVWAAALEASKSGLFPRIPIATVRTDRLQGPLIQAQTTHPPGRQPVEQSSRGDMAGIHGSHEQLVGGPAATPPLRIRGRRGLCTRIAGPS